jgi:Domain of unknown function (DUF4410)
MTTRIRDAAFAFVLVACLILAGCASGKVKVATVAPKAAMAKYTTVAITVCNDVGPKCPQDVSPNLQGAAISQLLAKYPGVFQEVRPAPTGAEGEMLVDVHITGYKKGSKLARAMMIGLGSSKLSTALTFTDSATKEKLATGQLSLTWAMGGILGASKGIDDVVNDAGAKIANAIVEQKRGTLAKAK